MKPGQSHEKEMLSGSVGTEERNVFPGWTPK